MISNKEESEVTASEIDNAGFVAGCEDYERFLAVLEEPPKLIPALCKLFSEPRVVIEK